MSDFQYEIVEEIGVLSTSAKGWNKEFNKVSWNGGVPSTISGTGHRTMKRWARV